MENKQIAEIFYEIANILDINGESSFRINAYRRGAQVVEGLGLDLTDMYGEDPKELENINGIGKALSEKIVELITTGKCEAHQKLLKDFPKGLLEMLKLRGVGPKKVKLFHHELGIKTLKELERAAKLNMLQELDRMGAKSEADILQALTEKNMFSDKRFLIDLALDEANAIIEYMKDLKDVKKIQYAGSLRRNKESIGDVDILITIPKSVSDYEHIMNHFVKFKKVYNVIAKGDTKSSVILFSGIQVDLRVVPSASFGAALHYFTGSKQHNIRIRDLAKKKGLKINEYGVFKGEKQIGGKTEEEIFESVGLPYIPPEIRRDSGEFEYAQKHKKAPDLVKIEDIRGDLHMHSDYSDGKTSIEEMVKACIERNYEYMAITDHSSLMAFVAGLNDNKIKKQWEEIDKLNKKYNSKIKIFKGCEVDILKDGGLDFADTILKDLDVVIISAHYTYKDLSTDQRTKRLISAIENKYTRILAHPTGRKIGTRPGMDMDMKKIFQSCKDNKVYLEINSNPQRLDLAEKHILLAREMGVKLVINTDAHKPANLDFLKFGVGMARRGWCDRDDVVNTRSISSIDNLL